MRGGMSTLPDRGITADALARRVRQTTRQQLGKRDAAMFLGYWLEHDPPICEEVSPGRFLLTDYGMSLAQGINRALDLPDDERKAA
jgi:hypothetical protein